MKCRLDPGGGIPSTSTTGSALLDWQCDAFNPVSWHVVAISSECQRLGSGLAQRFLTPDLRVRR